MVPNPNPSPSPSPNPNPNVGAHRRAAPPPLLARQHGQSAVWAVPQLGSCASSGHAWRLWAARNSWKEAGSLGAQSLPWVHELIACRAADFSAFDHLGAEVFMREQSWRNVRRRAQLVAHGNATADAKWAREVVTCGWPRGSMVKRVVLAPGKR